MPPFSIAFGLSLSLALGGVLAPMIDPPEEAAVRAVLSNFAAAWNDGDIERAVAVYTDPHVDANAPVPVLTRDETRRALEPLIAERRFSIRITSDEVVVEGGFALQRGEFVLTPVVEGGAAVTERYLEVLRRDADGRWRVFWSMDGPVAR